MNKKRFLALSVIVIFAAFGFALTAGGQTGVEVNGFTIVGADDNLEYSMSPVPGGLLTLLAQVADRFVLEAADSNREYAFNAVPGALLGFLGQVADRFVIEAADANHNYVLDYPVDLINDTTAPILSDINVRSTGPNSALVSWKTDEFATSEVRYGTSPGAYSNTVSDQEFTKLHELAITGLTGDVTYYYVVRSGDQSGNLRQSTERSFAFIAEKSTYLPVIIKQ